MLLENTGVHMTRRSGRFRSDMRPDVLGFVSFLHDVGDADALLKLGSATDVPHCYLCGSQSVELDDDGCCQVCICCTLCKLAHHANCLERHIGNVDDAILGAVSESCTSRGGSASQAVILRALAAVFAGPLASIQPSPGEVLCSLCSSLVSRALKGPREPTP